MTWKEMFQSFQCLATAVYDAPYMIFHNSEVHPCVKQLMNLFFIGYLEGCTSPPADRNEHFNACTVFLTTCRSPEVFKTEDRPKRARLLAALVVAGEPLDPAAANEMNEEWRSVLKTIVEFPVDSDDVQLRFRDTARLYLQDKLPTERVSTGPAPAKAERSDKIPDSAIPLALCSPKLLSRATVWRKGVLAAVDYCVYNYRANSIHFTATLCGFSFLPGSSLLGPTDMLYDSNSSTFLIRNQPLAVKFGIPESARKSDTAWHAISANLARFLYHFSTGHTIDPVLEVMPPHQFAISVRHATRTGSVHPGYETTLLPDFLLFLGELLRGSIPVDAMCWRIRAILPHFYDTNDLSGAGQTSMNAPLGHNISLVELRGGNRSRQQLAIRSKIEDQRHLFEDEARYNIELSFAQPDTLSAWTRLYTTLRMEESTTVFPDIQYTKVDAYGVSVTREAMCDVLIEYARHSAAFIAFDSSSQMIELRAGSLTGTRCAACRSIGSCRLSDDSHKAAQLAVLFFPLAQVHCRFTLGPMLLMAIQGEGLDFGRGIAPYVHAMNPNLMQIYELQKSSCTFAEFLENRYAKAIQFAGRRGNQTQLRVLLSILSDSYPANIWPDVMSMICNKASYLDLGMRPVELETIDAVTWRTIFFSTLKMQTHPRHNEETLVESINAAAPNYDISMLLFNTAGYLSFTQTWIDIIEFQRSTLRDIAREQALSEVPENPIFTRLEEALERATVSSAELTLKSWFLDYIQRSDANKLRALYTAMTDDKTVPRMILSRAQDKTAKRLAARVSAEIIVESAREGLEVQMDFSTYCAPKLAFVTTGHEPMEALQSYIDVPKDLCIFLAVHATPMPFSEKEVRIPVAHTCSRELHLSPCHNVQEFHKKLDQFLENAKDFSIY